MKPADPAILVINGGSSSIRFAVYWQRGPLTLAFHDRVERIGLPGTCLFFSDGSGGPLTSTGFAAHDHRSAATLLIDWLEGQSCFSSVTAVGHRIVHGMEHAEPESITRHPYAPGSAPASSSSASNWTRNAMPRTRR